ncbi:MAG: polysaccharide deacetylase family protein [Firmicutes bacterium]|nr:polysaccharide deacetylase family protein [Bacillota bacterium]
MSKNSLRKWKNTVAILVIFLALLVLGSLNFFNFCMPLKTGTSNRSSTDSINDNKNSKFERLRMRITNDTPPKVEKMSTPKSIPVLMYHCVNDKTLFKNDIERSLTIETRAFVEQLDWLKENGYHIVSLDDAYDAMTIGKKLPEKPVVLTFDDGNPDSYFNVYPILSRRNISGTFFIKVKEVENGQGLDWLKVTEMAHAGMLIESHTMTHANLTIKTSDEMTYELQKSRSLIWERTGHVARFLAYPFGRYDSRTIEGVKQAGYQAAFTTQPGFWKPRDNLFALKRVRVSHGETIQAFASSLAK